LAKKSSLERWKRDQLHPKFKVRFHNRCRICGRSRAYLRKFGMCRICFRTNAAEGRIPGVTKSSW
jgi:small subunit ribosomal protein S14